MSISPPRHVLVVGSGIAGLYSALRLRRAAPGTAVTLITKVQLEDSNTWHAQGGIAAVLPVPAAVVDRLAGPGGASVEKAGVAEDAVEKDAVAEDSAEKDAANHDTVASHVADTLVAGSGSCLPEAVQVLCAEAAHHIDALVSLRTPFDRTAAGELALGREAAHSTSRILHAGGDATGAAVAIALIAAVRQDPGITLLENAFLADLDTDGADAPTVTGAQILRDGAVSRLAADAVILATGGAGQLFTHNTNPEVATGDGLAAAWRAGAVVKDLEFFQFHPTALAVPGNQLISEAVRGEGAVLIDESGTRFMSGYHPAAELAPRDVISRSIALHLRERGEERVYLDATGLGGADFLAARFPSLHRLTAAHGFDWSAEPLPVVPAAHYWMGGIQTDLWGRTSLPGLYAVGEAACTGVHGANRLASNSLLEGLVFAGRAVDALTADDDGWPVFSAAPLELPDSARNDVCERRTLQRLMSDHAGVTRSGAGLEVAAKQLEQFSSATGTLEERETGNLLLTARLLVHAAGARKESLGAHYRTDFPSRYPEGSVPHLNSYRRAQS
ncbi:L-aspartate oxidase [Arthrobacter sp. H20]|uniref:L-aspartate oxidase n=1 Tax=Arthrobacter sp. H20 TaxID=1267981 RepID=UPI0004AFF447|nr:L-aspartate oxidase [Arthrobacter sp. H20]